MGHHYAEVAFTETIKALQRENGSRNAYAAMERGPQSRHKLTGKEVEFIQARDSFYMASVGETGWPYVQHRGGPKGFMRVLDEHTIGFADYSGNKQYISTGNFTKEKRTALFFMDYPNQRRLKMMGYVTMIGPKDPRMAALEQPEYGAEIEHGFLIRVEAFDWNCPQHITPRFDTEMIKELVKPLQKENRDLKRQLAQGGGVQTAKAWGDGPLALEISGVRQLTPSIRGFELRSRDGQPLPKATAGSHLQVPVMLDGALHWRSYSITSDPAERDVYEIAVKHEVDGNGGSAAVHQFYQLGMQLNARLPQNHFVLSDGDEPAVLLAAGIGITPVKAMAHQLKREGRSFELHYAVRSTKEAAFLRELRREFPNELRIYESSAGNRLDLSHLMAQMQPYSKLYLCGPKRLIEEALAHSASLSWEFSRLVYEAFGAAPIIRAKPVQLTLARSKKTLQIPADQSLLDGMLVAGVAAPFSCKTGTCKTCAVKVLAGEPDHRDKVLSPQEQSAEGLFCPCVSRSHTAHLTLDV
jgi:ferredoxin-NADP reductase/predicted pyridoxine 5'-phosphate oxidase superfamily flavin-nucleotide-binding protein